MKHGIMPGPNAFVLLADAPPKLCHDLVDDDLILRGDARPAKLLKHQESFVGTKEAVVLCGAPGPNQLAIMLWPETRVMVAHEAGEGWVAAVELKVGDRVRCYFGVCAPQALRIMSVEDPELARQSGGPVYSDVELHRVDKKEYAGRLHSVELEGEDQSYFAGWVMCRGGRW